MRMFHGFKKLSSSIKLVAATTVFAGSIFVGTFAPMLVQAATQNPSPTAKVSFTFDDGLSTALTQAAPTLAKYGLSGTDYVITGCVGMDTTPNTCNANTATSYMTWAQIAKLQTTYGWEIGSHTVSHFCLATASAACGHTKPLTPAQLTNELVNSKSTLAAHGINATDFSTPYGDYTNATLAQIAKYYASHRGFADTGYNNWPNNDYLIYDYPVQAGVTVAQVEQHIDQAIANNQWLVLTMHNIKAKASTNPNNYEYNTAQLDQIAAYVKAKQDAGLIKSTHISDGLVTSDSNLLANGSFNNGIANGWTTDAPTTITKDTGTNGSYPDPTNAIKMVSTSGKETHLFSPKVSISNGTTYMLKNFLNLQSISSGQVGFYIDEYDVNGNWISGQYKTAEKSAFVETMNFGYAPSSPSVASASLQVILSGTGITAYLDNTQWFVATTSTVTQTNLFTDGSFEAGLGAWATDASSNVTPDSLNNGSPASPKGSVKLTSTTRDAHLFSPKVAVDSAKRYTLTNYLNLTAINSGGEVAYYVDEYDAGGNWISGQYKLGLHAVGASDTSFAYAPSSANVKTASLQVIVTANSGVTAYFDNARWFVN